MPIGAVSDVRDGVLWVRSALAFDGYLRAGVLDRAADWTSVGDRVELSASGCFHAPFPATTASGARAASPLLSPLGGGSFSRR